MTVTFSIIRDHSTWCTLSKVRVAEHSELVVGAPGYRRPHELSAVCYFTGEGHPLTNSAVFYEVGSDWHCIIFGMLPFYQEAFP